MNQSVKRKVIIYAVVMFSAITICSTLFVLISAMHQPASANTGQQVTSEEKDYKYCVKDVSGKIAVFEKGNPEPIKTLETRTNLLPEYDREMLNQGIYLDSKEQLNSLLEDYDD